jgi:hypothetical protein
LKFEPCGPPFGTAAIPNKKKRENHRGGDCRRYITFEEKENRGWTKTSRAAEENVGRDEKECSFSQTVAALINIDKIL